MKLNFTILLSILSVSLLGQYIDGPANIRETPTGEKIFTINNFVKIDLRDNQPQNDWYEIFLRCYVLPDRLIDKTIIKQGTTLFSITGDSIGFTFVQFKVYENSNERYWKYNELEKIEISLKGHTYKSNIRDNLSRQEIIKNKLNYSDSCSCKYLTYQEEDGVFVNLIEKCKLYPVSLIVNGKYQDVFIRETQKIKQFSGAEGQESHIDLEIISNYLTENPVIDKFSVDADEIEINGKLIKSVVYGCCGGEDTYQLFNSTTHKKLMDYEEVLFVVKIPNSSIEAYIAYQTGGYQDGKGIIGSLIFSDEKSIINKVHFVTKDKNKFDNILRFVPEMEFKPTNAKDKISYDKKELVLWSKNNSINKQDLSGFKFLVHLIDDSTGKEYVQEVNFVNGYINGNTKMEFEINID